MQLYRVILPVGDIDEAAGFYESLLGVAGRRVSPGRHYLDAGSVILALELTPPGCHHPRPPLCTRFITIRLMWQTVRPNSPAIPVERCATY